MVPVKLEHYTVHGFTADHSDKEEFLVDTKLVDQWRDYGPSQKYYDASLIGETMENPTSIFTGLNRPGFEEARCYCGKPPKRWIDDQFEVDSPAGMVFAIYVASSVEKGALVVFDWDWVPEDTQHPGHPRLWQKHYEERTWPQTT
jgi:hypothetical protein